MNLKLTRMLGDPADSERPQIPFSSGREGGVPPLRASTRARVEDSAMSSHLTRPLTIVLMWLVRRSVLCPRTSRSGLTDSDDKQLEVLGARTSMAPHCHWPNRRWVDRMFFRL